MKLHRFTSNTISSAYNEFVVSEWKRSLIPIFIILVLFVCSDILRCYLDDSVNLSSKWWSFIAAIICFALFTLGRFILYKYQDACNGNIIRVSDIIYVIAYLALIYMVHDWLFSLDLPPHVMLTISVELAIYHLLIGFTMSHSTYNLISLVGMNIIDVVLGVTKYSHNNYAWLITTGCITLAEIYIVLYYERNKRRSFEKQYELLEKDRIWKDVLNGLPEGILILDKHRTVKYHNNALLSILPLGENTILHSINEIPSEDILMDEKPHSRILSLATKGVQKAKATNKQLTDLHALLSKSPNLKELLNQVYANWDIIYRLLGELCFIFYANVQMPGEDQVTKLEIKLNLKTFEKRISCLLVFSDITNRDLVVSLKQTLVHKDKMLASVSHELRTPLNGNINFVQAAIDNPTTPEEIKSSYLIPAVRSAKYLLTLINDILDMSQIQNNSFRLVPTLKSLVNTIQEAMQLIEIQASRKKIYLDLKLPHKGWDVFILTDHNRLLQVLANLLSNALKFTFSGGITITVVPEDEKSYLFCIEDTGIGIKEEHKKQLFRDYGKLDLGHQNCLNSQGVGLGLMISNTLAKMLGSQLRSELMEECDHPNGLWFESEYGKGTKFFFRVADLSEINQINLDVSGLTNTSIPTERGVIDYFGEKYESSSIFIPRGNQSRISLLSTARELLTTCRCTCPEILVADDDGFNQAVTETIFKTLGFSVLTCFNGKEALEAVQARIHKPCSLNACKPFKLIFLDCNMPIMDGYECAKRLKEIFEDKIEYKCPIIACTGSVLSSDIKKAMDSGMDDHCIKPITKASFQNLVNKYLK